MDGLHHPTYPLVSVIIPCYNHAAYLPDAIESVLAQTYPKIEIIVVNDGSADDTETVARQYSRVQYVFQENQGLSAARNTGIRVSQGDFLVFLDADDVLYKDAIAHNVHLLLNQPALAFVSGAYDLITVERETIKDVRREVTSDHYIQLLRGNYISMHATVMYRRWVFAEFSYDTRLRACEDYDLYLKVARKYPVLHHTTKIASYRMHRSNMSGNNILMLDLSLQVLARQRSLLRNEAERIAYKEGEQYWKDYYCGVLYAHLRAGHIAAGPETKRFLKKHKPKLYYRYLIASYYDKVATKIRS